MNAEVNVVREELAQLRTARSAIGNIDRLLLTQMRPVVLRAFAVGLSVQQIAHLSGLACAVVEGWLVKQVPRPRVARARPGIHADTKVVNALAAGPALQRDIAAGTGLAKSTVSKTVWRLVEAGRLIRLDDGRLALPTAPGTPPGP